MQRVSNSRVRDRLGFRQSGSGSGPVFVFFQSRVRVLPCRVSGLCRVSILCKKETYFGKKSKKILASENFSTFFSNLKKNYFIKWFEHRFIHELEIFLGFFLAKMVDFCPKIAVFNPYKTLRVSSGFDVGFGFGSGLC